MGDDDWVNARVRDEVMGDRVTGDRARANVRATAEEGVWKGMKAS